MADDAARRALTELARSGSDLRGYTAGLTATLRGLVPYDGLCLVTLDPASGLPVEEVSHDALPSAASGRLTEMEAAATADLNLFAHLVRAPRPVVRLSRASQGRLGRSRRHRELRAPHGFGDELRAVLAGSLGMWGALTLLRGHERPSFTEADVRRIGTLLGPMEEGVRRAALHPLPGRGRPGPACPDTGGSVPGVVVLEADGSVRQADRTWTALAQELAGAGGGSLPTVVRAVAARARAASGAGPASARVRASTGHWLVLHGSVLEPADPGAAVAVVIEPAHAAEVAPLVAAGYGLTRREWAVAELLAEGATTHGVARALGVSDWTAHDHVKAALAKSGASSRGELVSRLFLGL